MKNYFIIADANYVEKQNIDKLNNSLPLSPEVDVDSYVETVLDSDFYYIAGDENDFVKELNSVIIGLDNSWVAVVKQCVEDGNTNF